MLNECFGGVFKGKRVLLTGHTGFKGSWLAIWLKELGADVYGYSLDSPTTPSNFDICHLKKKINSKIGDVRDYKKLFSYFQDVNPEIVFHLAAQAIVLESYNNPVNTFTTNVQGTINVLEAIRNTPSVKAAVIITSDKCYDNNGKKEKFVESDRMGGSDPYSASKGMVELAVASYGKSFFSKTGQNVATVRAGNVIGGGDFANNRIVPDCMKSLMSKKEIILRRPDSIRPWQHVLEPLSGYLHIGSLLFSSNGKKFRGGWNFGPIGSEVFTVEQMTKNFISIWGSGKYVVKSDPNAPHEAAYLGLSCSKSCSLLSWTPVYSLNNALKETVLWFKEFDKKKNNSRSDMYDFCVEQIKGYSAHARNMKVVWARKRL